VPLTDSICDFTNTKREREKENHTITDPREEPLQFGTTACKSGQLVP